MVTTGCQISTPHDVTVLGLPAIIDLNKWPHVSSNELWLMAAIVLRSQEERKPGREEAMKGGKCLG